MTDMMDRLEQIVLQKEEHAYGFIIEVLTRGLYPNKFHVIREYVQNAYDAILHYRRDSSQPKHGRIQVKIAKPSIFIYDDGIGMNRDKINQYRYVGYSEKRTGQAAGFRGIGKLSGISVAEKLVITSSPAGVRERYKLVFDADTMLAQVLALKLEGKNISLNDLIPAHSTITVEDEDSDSHYTMVELYKVRDDSKALMDHGQLAQYLGTTAPVDFDPEFPHAKTVDGWLRQHVPDYDTVPLSLNGQPIYKPYLTELKPPQMIFVLDQDDHSQQGGSRSEGVGQEFLAFCWYCEHTEKGQLGDNLRRGLTYRLKNFAVGDNQLPRTTLWHSSPERAYYFFGEIHVCDPDIVPSSDRDNFEQNDARERLYARGAQISRTLNRIAGASSDQRRATEFIAQAEDIVHRVQAELQAGQMLREMKLDRTVAVYNAVHNVRKRLRHAPVGFRERAEEVMTAGTHLLERLEGTLPQESPPTFYDIRESLRLGPEARRIYDVIVDCLREELMGQRDLYERLVRRIHAALERDLPGKEQE